MITVQVYVLRCGCGYVASAAHVDTVKATLLDHVMYTHRGTPDPEPTVAS